jgi:F0F1-type ATP synthase membrane subunit c/vacuolar-type H+-ATPase subunit K
VIDQQHKTLTILYVALVGSLGMYAFVAFSVAGAQEPRELQPIMLPTFIGLSLAMMAMIPFLRSKILPPMKEAASLSENIPENDQTRAATAKFFSASIVTWALCESIGIYGLVLAFLSAQPKYFLGFGAASLVNFLIYRPRRDQLLAVARAAS